MEQEVNAIVKKTRRGQRGGSKAETVEIKTTPVTLIETPLVEEAKKRRRGKRGSEKKNISLPGPEIVESQSVSFNENEPKTFDVIPSLELMEQQQQARVRDQPTFRKAYREVPITQEVIAPTIPAISSEIRNYLMSIEAKIHLDDFEDAEDRDVFLMNVYKEIDTHEVQIAGDPDCSRVLEALLRCSNDFHIRVFFTRLAGNFEVLLTHQFASHVCQTLLILAADVVHREESGESIVEIEAQELSLDTTASSILQFCGELKDHWMALLRQRYASHVFRTLLNVLSGEKLVTDDTTIRSKKSKNYNARMKVEINQPIVKQVFEERKIPDTFNFALQQIVNGITESLDRNLIRKLSIEPVASPVLQLLVKMDRDNKLAKAMLCDENGDISFGFVRIIMEDRVGSHLMEKIVRHIPNEEFDKMYNSVFKTHLMEFCMHPMANFVVQSLLECIQSAAHIDAVLRELLPEIPKLISISLAFSLTYPDKGMNRAGVLSKLANACMVYKSGQMEFFKGLITSLEMHDEGKECIRYISYLRPLHKIDMSLPIAIQGSVIIQKLLGFEKEISEVVIESLISTDKVLLQKWCCDVTASRMIEEAEKSETISYDLKWKLIKKLSGSFVAIAKDKFGSHVIDKFWAASDLDMKKFIASELVRDKTALVNNSYGRFIVRNCQLDQFENQQQGWVEKQQGVNRKKTMFDDIIQDAENSLLKKSKKDVAAPLENVKTEKPNLKKRKTVKDDDSLDLVLQAIVSTKKLKK